MQMQQQQQLTGKWYTSQLSGMQGLRVVCFVQSVMTHYVALSLSVRPLPFSNSR